MVRLSAKVGPLHVGIGDDRRGCALADDLARVEADHALREAHHRLHDVLDHDDGDALGVQAEQDLQHLVDLAPGKPGHRLVRDEQARLRRHRARELELAQLDLRELVRLSLRLVGEPDPPQDLHRLLLGVGLLEMHHVLVGHEQVLEHRHAVEGPRDLEAARDAFAGALVGGEPGDFLALELDRAAVVAQRTRNAVDQRGLARAVGPDQTEALTRGDGDAHLRQRGEAAEVLGHALHPEERRAHRFLTNFRNRPSTPSGANTTNSTSSTPITSTLISLEMVTVTICWIEARSSAPITGPSQWTVPPIIGMASAETE